MEESLIFCTLQFSFLINLSYSKLKISSGLIADFSFQTFVLWDSHALAPGISRWGSWGWNRSFAGQFLWNADFSNAALAWLHYVLRFRKSQGKRWRLSRPPKLGGRRWEVGRRRRWTSLGFRRSRTSEPKYLNIITHSACLFKTFFIYV